MAPKAQAESMDGRVSAVEEWSDNHDQECARRYEAIQVAITDIRGVLKALVKGAIGLLIAIVGWCLVQLYNGAQIARTADRADVSANSVRLDALERREPATVSVVVPPKP